MKKYKAGFVLPDSCLALASVALSFTIIAFNQNNYVTTKKQITTVEQKWYSAYITAQQNSYANKKNKMFNLETKYGSVVIKRAKTD